MYKPQKGSPRPKKPPPVKTPEDEEFEHASFKMEIDITPLERKRFAFTEKYLERKLVPNEEKCAMCACGSCDCVFPPLADDDDNVAITDPRASPDSQTQKKLPTKSLKELYMMFIGDTKEWNKFVTTSKLVDRKSKNETYIFSNLAMGETGETEDVQRLTDFERWAMLALLNELIDKLIILGAKKPKVVPQLNFHPPKVRYHAKIRKRMYDSDTNLLISEGEGARDICRFQKLRTLLEHVVKITRDEISERSTCDSLQGFLSLEEKRMMEEKVISGNYTDSKSLIRTLKKIKLKNDKDTKIVIENFEEQMKVLKKELQHEMFRYGVYLSYFKDWAEAEFESEKYDKDKHYFKWIENELKRCEQACDTESRVHRDVLMFLKLSTTKLEKDVKRWSNKYDKDMEEKDSEIATMKQKRKDLHKRMGEMLHTFDSRQSEIQAYLKERAERERKAAEEKRLNDAATRIQAWWRGTMVRWEFGKFDSAGGKKKKAKGKASKAKK